MLHKWWSESRQLSLGNWGENVSFPKQVQVVSNAKQGPNLNFSAKSYANLLLGKYNVDTFQGILVSLSKREWGGDGQRRVSLWQCSMSCEVQWKVVSSMGNKSTKQYSEAFSWAQFKTMHLTSQGFRCSSQVLEENQVNQLLQPPARSQEQGQTEKLVKRTVLYSIHLSRIFSTSKWQGRSRWLHLDDSANLTVNNEPNSPFPLVLSFPSLVHRVTRLKGKWRRGWQKWGKKQSASALKHPP